MAPPLLNDLLANPFPAFFPIEKQKNYGAYDLKSMVVLSFMMTSDIFGLDFGLLVRLAIRKYILIIFWSKK